MKIHYAIFIESKDGTLARVFENENFESEVEAFEYLYKNQEAYGSGDRFCILKMHEVIK